MPRDGSGNYTRAAGPYVGGTTIEKDDVNAEYDDVATALSDSINKAGTKAWAADQPMGGFKFTGLGAGSAAGHSVRYEQVFPSVFQPLDATLTALAGLSWSSGSPLVQFTAADTVSLTLTPSVNTITAASTVAATHSVTAKNTTDNASVAALRIEGDRATPATDDVVYASWYLSNAAGTQVEFMRITAQGVDITAGSVDGRMVFSTAVNNSVTDQILLQSGIFSPFTNDALSLGLAAAGWSDLFLAEGGTINWDNGDAILTQTGDVLELTGAGMAARAVQVTGVGGETLAAATHRNRMLLLDGDITIDDGIFTAGDYGMLIADGTNRTVTRAAGATLYVNGVDSATATIPAHTVAGFVAETAAIIHLTGSAV